MDLKEHVYKELIKKTVDNSPNYSERMKAEMKTIIDEGKSPEEICQAIVVYLAGFRWF